MAERRRARARAPKDAADAAERGAQGVEEVANQPRKQTEEVLGQAGDQGAKTLTAELKDAIRHAAIEVLSPVARNATTIAAKYAVDKGPEIINDKVAPMLGDAGGALELAKKAGGAGGLVSKLKRDKGDGPSAGRRRRLPIQGSVDVAVPPETAYNQYTQFEDFSEFMHRVERVEQKDETHIVWHENVWGVRWHWESEITEQRPNERIAWEATSGGPQKGVVTFHRLSDRLTRVEVTLDQQPTGLFAKAPGLRMTRRALKSDLMRFKAFIETEDEESGAWRGAVDDGEFEAEEPEALEPEDEELDEDEYTDEEEAQADEYAEPEDEQFEEEEDEEPKRKPVRRRPAARRRSPAARRKNDEEEEEPKRKPVRRRPATRGRKDEEKPKTKRVRRRPAARRRSPAARSSG